MLIVVVKEFVGFLQLVHTFLSFRFSLDYDRYIFLKCSTELFGLLDFILVVSFIFFITNFS